MTEFSVAATRGLFAMRQLAARPEPLSLPAAAKAGGLDPLELRPLFRRLVAAGLLKSLPGKGYVLSRPAGQISVWDVVSAVEPLQEPHAPCGGHWEACAPRASCTLAPVCRQAQEGFREALRKMSLGELREAPAELPLCAPRPPGSS